MVPTRPPASRMAAVAAVAVTVAVTAAVTAAPADAASATVQRTITDPAVHESSGLARSTYPRGTVWTHNDSGDRARIFAVGRTGRVRAEIAVGGATNRDWEDIAAGPGHTLWIGDIGDNGRRRSTVSVYRLLEPRRLADGTVPSRRFDLAYPDGAHDAEALMVHPRTGRVFVVSKQRTGAAIYRAPRVLRAGAVNRLTKVGAAPSTVTAASYFPRGRRFVLGSYTTTYLYRLGVLRRQFRTPGGAAGGESLEVARTGRALLYGSEGRSSRIYRVPLA